MDRAFAILIVAALTAVAVPADAAACEPTSSQPELDTGETPTGRYYLDDDCVAIVVCQMVLMSFWVYEESNGIEGLQRDDPVKDDTCNGLIEGDAILL